MIRPERAAPEFSARTQNGRQVGRPARARVQNTRLDTRGFEILAARGREDPWWDLVPEGRVWGQPMHAWNIRLRGIEYKVDGGLRGNALLLSKVKRPIGWLDVESRELCFLLWTGEDDGM